MDKEAAPHKSIDGQPQIPELTSNALMLPALCSLQGEKKGVKPQLLPSLFQPESKRTDQEKARTFHVHPGNGASS